MHAPHIVPEQYAQPYIAQGLPDERAKFYGMIANFDENMGRLFARLKSLGLDEDTWSSSPPTMAPPPATIR